MNNTMDPVMNTALIPLGSVVVGVDGWPATEDCLAWAAEEAFLNGRDLSLVHARPDRYHFDPAGLPPEGVPDPEESAGRAILERAEAAAQRRGGLLAQGKFAGHRRPAVRVVEAIGDPAAALVAASRRASMLALGSHGRGPIRRRILGSVARSVIVDAACPVAILRPGHAEGVRRGILVGADGTERSLAALEFAYREASRRALPLTVLHCFEDATGEFDGPGPVDEAERHVASRRLMNAESVAGMRERYPDVRPHLRLARGRPEEQLAEAADAMHMVVLGAAPDHGSHRHHVGDVVGHVLDRAHTIVTVVPASALVHEEQDLTVP